MTTIGPPTPQRDHWGSIDSAYYVARAKRCRNRAIGEWLARLFAVLRPRRRAVALPRPALAGAAPGFSKTGTLPGETDNERAHGRTQDAPSLLA